MKRVFSIVFALLVMFSCSCCSVSDETPQHTASVTISTEPYSSDLPAELQQYCAPWTGDASAEAIHDGKIHYYFMSGKGMLMDPNESDPYKWGDSTLIVFPNGQTMLIDVGMEAYAPVLAENLKRMGIDRLDYLMVSHPHGDHMGGIIAPDSFLDMIRVDTLLYSGIDRGEKSNLLYSQCSDRNIPIQILKKGDVLEFGPVRMEILWPKEGTDGKVITKTAAINNQSIVARFDYKDHSSLFVGDLYIAGETMVMAEGWTKLDVDLLKVPHHGYATSSSKMFIDLTSPKLAVAMSGYRASIQWSYEARRTTFLYDGYEGYIHVKSDGTDLSYDTERNSK